MTYRCPIDGRELAEGKACSEHGIAFNPDGRNGTVVASTKPIGNRPAAADKTAGDRPATGRKRKATR